MDWVSRSQHGPARLSTHLGICRLYIFLGKSVAGFAIELDAIGCQRNALVRVKHARRSREKDRLFCGDIPGALSGSCLRPFLIMKIARLICGNDLSFVVELRRQLTRFKDAIRLAGNSINNLCVGRAVEGDRTILVIEYRFKMPCADCGLSCRLLSDNFRWPAGSNR